MKETFLFQMLSFPLLAILLLFLENLADCLFKKKSMERQANWRWHSARTRARLKTLVSSTLTRSAFKG